jgi:hypothetical protein
MWIQLYSCSFFPYYHGAVFWRSRDTNAYYSLSIFLKNRLTTSGTWNYKGVTRFYSKFQSKLGRLCSISLFLPTMPHCRLHALRHQQESVDEIHHIIMPLEDF